MQIVTRRLVLRELVPDDWPVVLAYQSDERYLRYYHWTERTESDVRAFVQMLADLKNEQPRRKFQLAITLRDEPRLIGNCGIRRKPDNEWEADIRYELAAEHWGKGYATEAAQTLVDFGFRELGLHRISASCVTDNLGSVHVLERLGMRREGLFHEKAHFKGRWWDASVYGLLEREWAETHTR